MRTRRIAAALALAVLTGCQPGAQPPPSTAAPQAAALPAANPAPKYDAAVAPVDETRSPEKVAPKAVISKATADQAAERARRQAEAERKEKAEAERAKAAAAKRSSAASAELPSSPAPSLSLPEGGGSLPLPKPIRDGRRLEASRPGANAAMPPSMERPELPRAAAVEPAKPAAAKAVAVPPAPPAPAPEPAPPVEPSPQPATESAEPKVAGAPPVPSPSVPSPPAQSPPVQSPPVQPPAVQAPATPSPRRPPNGPPLGTVSFDPRSAELSDGMRAALAFFARDANAQGVRQVELWATASDEDPVLARKVALARALAVHAYLKDVGLKARLDIGGYIEAHEGGADRVDLLTPKR